MRRSLPVPMAPDHPSRASGDVTRRVVLPADLDRALEAVREVSGESRDAALARLLGLGLQSSAVEAPRWALALVERETLPPSLSGALAASAEASRLGLLVSDLSSLVASHRAWLSAHEAALEEAQGTSSRAVDDLRAFGEATQGALRQMESLRGSIDAEVASQRALLLSSIEGLKEALCTSLDGVKAHVESSSSQVKMMSEAHGEQVKGLRSLLARSRKVLRLTPMVSVSIVSVACVLAVVTSLFFVPTYQKFTEEAYVNTQVLPVVQAEMRSSLASIEASYEAKLDELLSVKNEKIDKSIAAQRKEINSLREDTTDLLSGLTKSNTDLRAEIRALEKESEEHRKLAKSIGAPVPDYYLDPFKTEKKEGFFARKWKSLGLNGLHVFFLGLVGLGLLFGIIRAVRS